MKRITNILLIAVLTLFATSCEEVMEIDESGLESPLVLNSIPSNGNQMFVNFTKTRFFLDDYNHPLDNVDMTLYVNGVRNILIRQVAATTSSLTPPRPMTQ